MAEASSPASTEPDRPLLVIESGRAPLAQYARDLFHFRDLIGVFAVREIRLRYRQTALGATWVILQPLLAAGILSFVFGKIAALPTDGIPFFVFAFCSLLLWTAFSSTIGRTTSSLVSNAPLIAKVFFPRLLLPLSVVAAVILDFCVGFVVLLIMLVTQDLVPDARILLVPIWLALAIMLAEGIGAVLAGLSVRYRDVPQITPVVLQLWLYLSPVAYAVSAIPPRYRSLYLLNPLVALLEAFRWSVLGTSFPSTESLLGATAVAVVAFVAGLLMLENMERSFADVI